MLGAKLTVAQRVYLDCARAAAAIAVLTGHAANIFLQGSRAANSNIEIVGVMIFFLLSGFLISFSVFKKYADAEYGFAEYFIERFCRIYCAFLPALISVGIIDSWCANSPVYLWQQRLNIQTGIGNILMLQDFPLFQIARRLGAPDTTWFIRTFGSAGPFWTISIEWWIYMVFGAIVLIRLRTDQPFKLWQWLLVAFAAIEPAYHFVAGPDRCLTMLWALGMCVAWVFCARPQWFTASAGDARWRRTCYLIAASCLMGIIIHRYAAAVDQDGSNVAEFQSGLLLAGVLFALFFACGALHQVPKLLERGVGFVANYSYSLYLVHYTILIFIKAIFARDYDPLAFGIGIVASNAVAMLFWYLFERHYRSVAASLKALVAQRRDVSSAVA